MIEVLDPTDSIFTAIEAHQAGEILRNTHRWTKFRVDEDWTLWRDLVGPNSNVLEHSKAFALLTSEFTNQEQDRFNRRDKRKMVIAACVHDLGEVDIDGNGVGDVPSYLKNGEHETKEALIARHIISELDLSDSFKKEMAVAYEGVIVGYIPELHLGFKAFEKTDYVKTAIDVWKESKRREKLGMPILLKRDQFVGQVIIHDLMGVLTRYVDVFPYSVGKYVQSIIPIVDEAYEQTRDSLYANNLGGNLERNEKQIPLFEEKWQEFKTRRG
jgi:hypothetical protein